MLILGINTADRQGSVALLESKGTQPAQSAEREEAKTLELASLGEGHSSELLVPAIDELLARHRVQKRSLSLIAVAGGPGSFTGLRVAVATAKGLAEALAIPLVAVSVLEAVAVTSGLRGWVVAGIDAQRGELFFGEYVVEGGGAERVREEIAAIDSFLSELDSGSPLTIVTPDASLAARLRPSADLALTISEVRRPTAADIARIAHNKFLIGERANVASLDANYLRRSDAEIVAARKPQV